MDGAEQGVVLITFGSTFPLSNLEPHYINIFLEAMRKLSRVRFIWRWVGPMPDGHPRNLMAAEWLPQREILSENLEGLIIEAPLNSIYFHHNL